ncbi:MAG: hypothetical protein LLG20_14005 [Acidobacteriales bacterium]|nr:hypothetical protein [Terriglobales bacterium]
MTVSLGAFFDRMGFWSCASLGSDRHPLRQAATRGADQFADCLFECPDIAVDLLQVGGD